MLSNTSTTVDEAVSAAMHGYLNCKIERHLWPGMTMLQYRKVQPLVKSLAAEYGVSYVQAVLRTLKTMRKKAVVRSQKRLQTPATLGACRIDACKVALFHPAPLQLPQ